MIQIDSQVKFKNYAITYFGVVLKNQYAVMNYRQVKGHSFVIFNRR